MGLALSSSIARLAGDHGVTQKMMGGPLRGRRSALILLKGRTRRVRELALPVNDEQERGGWRGSLLLAGS